MIDPRYLQYLLMAAVACGLAALCMWVLGNPPSAGASMFSFFVGPIVTSLITVRLPVFRDYYNATEPAEFRKHRGFANERAAPVMASLIAGVIIGIVLHVFEVENVEGPALIGAVCAGVVSHYHRKRR